MAGGSSMPSQVRWLSNVAMACKCLSACNRDLRLTFSKRSTKSGRAVPVRLGWALPRCHHLHHRCPAKAKAHSTARLYWICRSVSFTLCPQCQWCNDARARPDAITHARNWYMQDSGVVNPTCLPRLPVPPFVATSFLRLLSFRYGQRLQAGQGRAHKAKVLVVSECQAGTCVRSHAYMVVHQTTIPDADTAAGPLQAVD
jgi:hypothetical protein